MKKIFLIVLVSLTAGCTQMYFDRAEPVQPNTANSQSEWHSNMVFALVEVSAPVDLNQKCQSSEWESVKTETSFTNALVGVIPYMSWIWSPKTVTVECQGLPAEK